MKKVAVIAGGFGNIGYAITQELVQRNYAVVILSRTAEDAVNASKFAELGTEDKLAIMCDVTKATDMNHAVQQVMGQYGQIDVLVNSVGWSKHIPHTDMDTLTDELFDKVVTVNLRSVYSCVSAFRKCFNTNSVIVNISSAAAQSRGGSNLAYSAAKAGVDSLTRNLALTLAPAVRVVGVSPGYVDTPTQLPATKDRALTSTPLQRVASVNDVSGVVIGAIDNKFLNGITIVVDGGRSL